MLFGHLTIGDKFIYDGRRYEFIPVIKVGCCTPQWNAKELDSEEYYFFHGEYQIEKIDEKIEDVDVT